MTPPPADTPPPPRDPAGVADAFLRLADALSADVDVLEVLEGLASDCVSLFADAAGLMMGDAHGTPLLVASSHDAPPVVGLFELQADEGPSRECLRTNAPVLAADLEDPDLGRRWPRFTARATAEGFRAAHALPMRLRTRAVGALNLMRVRPGSLPEDDLRAVQALVDVATLGILAGPVRHSPVAAADQLRAALIGRAVVEQAKGVVAQRAGLDIPTASERLRHHARTTGGQLTEIARRVVDGSLDVATVLGRPDL